MRRNGCLWQKWHVATLPALDLDLILWGRKRGTLPSTADKIFLAVSSVPRNRTILCFHFQFSSSTVNFFANKQVWGAFWHFGIWLYVLALGSNKIDPVTRWYVSSFRMMKERSFICNLMRGLEAWWYFYIVGWSIKCDTILYGVK